MDQRAKVRELLEVEIELFEAFTRGFKQRSKEEIRMKIIRVPADNTDYHGCGYAWAAIDEAGNLAALRYMDPQTGKRENESYAAFNRRRRKALDELAPLGRIVTGMLSCWDFIVNFEPKNNPHLLNPEHPLEVLQGGKEEAR